MKLRVKDIPKNFPVKPFFAKTKTGRTKEKAKHICTCGTCGLSWDDAILTAWTPAHSGRCPFEYFHFY